MKNQIIVGIESTAHTLSIIGIDEKKRIIFEKKEFYFPKEGMIPMFVSRHHRKIYYQWRESIIKTMSSFNEHIIGFSSSIGFKCGLELAKEIATDLTNYFSGIQIPCPHDLAHLEMGKSGFTENVDTGIYAYISGSNTQVGYFLNNQIFPLIETSDLALGNLFDIFARKQNLEMPGGPVVETLAEEYSGNLEKFPFPLQQNRFNFTGIIEWLRKKEWSLSKQAYHLQENTFRAISQAIEKIYFELINKKTPVNHLIFSGGVCMNKRLVRELLNTAEYLNIKAKDISIPRYHGDNGFMIALLAKKYLSRKEIFSTIEEVTV